MTAVSVMTRSSKAAALAGKCSAKMLRRMQIEERRMQK
jgi:hypothetical protein